MRHFYHVVNLALVAFTVGCGSETSAPTESESARLTRYRDALPTRAALEVTAPEATGQGLIGDPADAPRSIGPIVRDVNGAVVNLLTIMRTVTNLPPSFYDAATKEYFWGLAPNDDGVGFIGVYMREHETDAEFRYSYALGRAPSEDIAGFVPVIWGGANPGATGDGHGTGAMMWDFEANHEFDLAHFANYDEANGTRGRLVAVYGRGPDETEPAKIVTLVYAAFRNFSEDGEPAIDAEYFYGKVRDGANDVQFVDVVGERDFAMGDDEAPETMQLRAAYFNSGIGRAEMSFSGGGVADGETAQATECWNVALDRTYYAWTLGEASGGEGELAGCGAVFAQTLDELNVPSLQAVPQAQRDLLGSLAESGIPN